MRSKPKKTAANPTVIQDENLVSTIPGLERKGDANLCHQWQHVYFASSIESAGDPAARRQECRVYEEIQRRTFRSVWSVMKEYVETPQALLKKTKELKRVSD